MGTTCVIVERISAPSRSIFDDHEAGGRATDPVNVVVLALAAH
jgi:hypothetical protein